MGNTWVLQLSLQHSSSPVKCTISLVETEPRQHCDQTSWLPSYPQKIFLVHAQNALSFSLPAFPGLTPLQNMAYMDSDTGMFYVACSDPADIETVAGAKRNQQESEDVKIVPLDFAPIFVLNGLGDAKEVLSAPLSSLEFPKLLSFFLFQDRGLGC